MKQFSSHDLKFLKALKIGVQDDEPTAQGDRADDIRILCRHLQEAQRAAGNLGSPWIDAGEAPSGPIFHLDPWGAAEAWCGEARYWRRRADILRIAVWALAIAAWVLLVAVATRVARIWAG